MTGLFVTGTGTNVGKTVISAALCHRYRHIAPLRYWKPVQTGAPEDDDTSVVRELGRCRDEEICTPGIRLPRPLSPHLSAQLCGEKIRISSLLRIAATSAQNRSWIVEGAGGVLVPLSENELMIDLMAATGLPTVVVASSQLGTINHTLLTLEALCRRSIAVAGVILNGVPNADNRRAIELHGNVAVIGEAPLFSELTPDALAGWASRELDRERCVDPILTGAPQ